MRDTTSNVAFLTESLRAFTAGRDYHSVLEATGGTPPYAFTITKGALPQGIVLNSDGTVSGRVGSDAKPGTVFIVVTDQNGREATQAFDVQIIDEVQ